jgi:heptosyltransferase-2
VVNARTLIVQPLPGIGDMVWHLRHLHAIAAAAPGGRVDLLAKPRSQADRLLLADPTVARVLWLRRGPGEHDGLPGLLRLAALMRLHGYEAVWILHGSWRYALAAQFAGIGTRIGYGRGLQRCFLTRPGLRAPARHHAIENADRLLDTNGLAFTEPEPRLPVAPQAAAAVEARYGALPRPWVALGIGGSEPFKHWGRENFASLAAALSDPGRRSLFLLGGAEEADQGAWIAERVRAAGGAAELTLDLPLEQAVALTAACRLSLGNDTGLLNVAAAVGVDAVGLFGGSPPLAYSPRIHPLVPPAGTTGMAGIGLDQVLEAARRFGVAPRGSGSS